MSTTQTGSIDISKKKLAEANPPGNANPFGDANPLGAGRMAPGRSHRVLDSVFESVSEDLSSAESDSGQENVPVGWWARLIGLLPIRRFRRKRRQIEHVSILRNDLWASDWDVRIEDSNCLELELRSGATRRPAKAARRWWWRGRR